MIDIKSKQIKIRSKFSAIELDTILIAFDDLDFTSLDKCHLSTVKGVMGKIQIEYNKLNNIK